MISPRLRRLYGRLGNALLIGFPYGWLLLFFVIPLIIILKISFSQSAIRLPPYTPLIEWPGDYLVHIRLTLENYANIFTDDLYMRCFLNSVGIALGSTMMCLLLGYPMAFGISQSKPGAKVIFLMFVMLPFAASSLVRVYAWIGFLSPHGLVNRMLMGLGILNHPLPLMGNVFSVTIGIIHCYLPFMVLSLYAALEKIDPALLEAASDLGCHPISAFWKVVIPLSLPGAISGSLLVFIPAVGEFMIPELLGGPQTVMIGRVLWNEFFCNRDWPQASALVIVLLLILLLPIVIFQHFQNKDIEKSS